MPKQELKNYIKQQLNQGVLQEEIKKSLLSAGWGEVDIEEAFNHAASNVPQPDFSSPKELPGAWALLKESWGIYKKRWKVFAGVIIIPSSILFILIFCLLFTIKKFSNNILFIFPFLILFVAVVSITSIWEVSSLMASVVGSSKRISVKKSLKEGWGKLLSYWWVSALTGLVISVGFIFFIIPGIIFWIQYSQARFIFYEEEAKGSKALSKSKAYIKGKWGSVCWRLAVIILPTLILVFGMGLAQKMFKTASLVLVGQLVRFVVLALILAPFGIVYEFLLYKHLKSIKGEIKETGSSVGIIIFAILGFLVIIGGLLMTVALVNLNHLRQKARDTQRKTDLYSVIPYLLEYDNDNGKFPDLLDELVPKYTDKSLKDPKTNSPYEYKLNEKGDDFIFCADFELEARKCVNSYGDMSNKSN